MATPIWNQRNLTSPPIVHLPVSFTLSENVTLQKYQAILTDMKAELRLLNVMQKEAWIFHRILSKCEESEKNMKWFRECKAILNCFDRLRKMKIEDITAAMQPQTDNDNLQGSNRWPSCQMLEYFLVRLIGFAALCQYIWSKGYKTNQLLLQNIEKNILFFRHFSKFGCISRMQILSEHLLEKSCRWYTVLYPWLQCLPKLEADWLPEGATLPNSVEEALGDKLVELRNIASQRGTKKENVRKSILDKIFGMRDSEDMLPQLVLKDDVVSKSSGMKKEAESTKSVEMSLDDIFNGLVDLSVKKTSTLSMLKQKGEGSRREDNSKIMEDNDKITPNMISKDGELSTKNNRQNREDKLKATQSSYCKSEVDVNQSQDLGVPISREEHQEQTKRKKKKKEVKRKRNEDDVFGDSDVHKRMKEQPIKKEETFMQDHLLKGEHGGLKGEKALELVNMELLTDDPRVEDEQTQPANIAKKKKNKKNKLSSNISKQELFDEWLMMSETLSGSNAPTDDSHGAKKKLKRSKVGTEQAADECDPLNNLGIRTSPLNGNKTRKRQKAELGYDGIGLNSPGMEKSTEVPLGSEAGTTPVVDSDVISKKRKKKHWKNIDNVEEDRLSFHPQQASEKTLIEHEMQSAITVKQETAAPMKKKTKKKKKNVNHSSLYDESERASLEVKRQTNIAGPSGGAEQAGNNNNGLDLRSAAEMNALVLKSKVTNGNKKKRKKKKKKRFLTDI